MDRLSVPLYQAYTDMTCVKAHYADLLIRNREVLSLGKRYVIAKDIMAAVHMHEAPTEPSAWYMQSSYQKPASTAG